MQPPRIILYHKHPTSARTRFLRLAHGGVCGPAPLPEGASLVSEGIPAGALAWHPAAVVGAAERSLGLPGGSLEADAGFRALIEAPHGPVEVLLAHFTAMDPPFEAVETIGGAFIQLTQARGMAPVELALLRRAYEAILG